MASSKRLLVLKMLRKGRGASLLCLDILSKAVDFQEENCLSPEALLGQIKRRSHWDYWGVKTTSLVLPWLPYTSTVFESIHMMSSVGPSSLFSDPVCRS